MPDSSLLSNSLSQRPGYRTCERLPTSIAQPGRYPVTELLELGKVQKTIFLCSYLQSEALRREIQEGLNVIENWNSATNFIHYGRHGELSTNKWEDQELAMLALHLLQIALVFIQALMIQEVLTEEVLLIYS